MKIQTFIARTAAVLIAIALLFGAGMLTGRRVTRERLKASSEAESSAKIDTIVRIDTVRYAVTRLVEVRRTDTVYVTDIDTVTLRDTFFHAVPISQARFSDSLYEAWVSGYKPRLDSIHVHVPVMYITTERTVPEDGGRWGVGVTAGYGVGAGGLTPFVGVGFTYDIIRLKGLK